MILIDVNDSFLHYFSMTYFVDRCMSYNAAYRTVISADSKGVMEYWDVDTLYMPDKPVISFSFKTESGSYVHH